MQIWGKDRNVIFSPAILQFESITCMICVNEYTVLNEINCMGTREGKMGTFSLTHLKNIACS